MILIILIFGLQQPLSILYIQVQCDATILLVRNPIDAMVSYWKWYLVYRHMYRNEGRHTTNPPVAFFREYIYSGSIMYTCMIVYNIIHKPGNNNKWNIFVKTKLPTWMEMIKRELSHSHSMDSLLIVTYEDLKSNVSREVGVATIHAYFYMHYVIFFIN